MSQPLRIVYMETPEFAVPALRIISQNNWNLVGVITAPDKQKGRDKADPSQSKKLR